MLFHKDQTIEPDQFWRDYEESTQEKVLAKSLAHYISGWPEYRDPLWGLAIATSGGFRFHHFAHETEMGVLFRLGTRGEPPREKTIFIPKEKIVDTAIRIEKHWWKRLILPSGPRLKLRYGGLDGFESELLVEGEKNLKDVAAALLSLV